LLVGWLNTQGQQIPRCIHSHIRLGVVAHRSRRAARSRSCLAGSWHRVLPCWARPGSPGRDG
jgi:hypothetical protein